MIEHAGAAIGFRIGYASLRWRSHWFGGRRPLYRAAQVEQKATRRGAYATPLYQRAAAATPGESPSIEGVLD